MTARMNHAAELVALLPGYLRRPRWLALAAAVARQIQEFEDVHQAMLAANALDHATGDMLDQLGKLVRQPRGGASDVDYRRRIRAKVAVNRSMGLVEDIIRICRLVVNDAAVDVRLDLQGTAAYAARLFGPGVAAATATDLAAFTRRATSAGVRSILEYSPVADDDTLTFDGPAGRGFVAVPTLELGKLPLPSGISTIVGVRDEWLADDGTAATPISLDFAVGASLSLAEAPDSVTVTFVAGTSTIADVEALLATSQYLFVVSAPTTPGTTVLVAGDAFPVELIDQSSGTRGGVMATALE